MQQRVNLNYCWRELFFQTSGRILQFMCESYGVPPRLKVERETVIQLLRGSFYNLGVHFDSTFSIFSEYGTVTCTAGYVLI